MKGLSGEIGAALVEQCGHNIEDDGNGGYTWTVDTTLEWVEGDGLPNGGTGFTIFGYKVTRGCDIVTASGKQYTISAGGEASIDVRVRAQ